MNIRKISQGLFASGQIRPEHVSQLALHGIRAIICNRPDGEEAGQPRFEEIERAARAAGIRAVHIPVHHGAIPDETALAFCEAMRALPGPVLAYCRSGARSTQVHEAAQNACLA